MRDPRQVAPGPGPALGAIRGLRVVLAAGLFVLLAGGCEMMAVFESPDSAARQVAEAQPLPLGSWTRDNLHCATGRCQRVYRIDLDDPGMLQVDLYAPAGENLPDCQLLLETDEGKTVVAETGRIQTRRRLRAEAPAGTYLLRVLSKGKSQDRFDFEMVAELAEGKAGATAATSHPHRRPTAPAERPKPPAATTPRPAIPVATIPEAPAPAPSAPPSEGEGEGESAAPTATPAAPPAPAFRRIEAVVLDVEQKGGRPSVVMLEAGAPTGVKPGMTGELFDAGKPIGRVEVMDVYPSGSRARIVGELSAPITFDTVSRFEIPAGGDGAAGNSAESRD